MKKITTKEFIQKAHKIRGDKFDYSKVNYINSQTKICLICRKHGEFLQNPGNHLNNNAGCPKCKGSSISKKLKGRKHSYKTKKLMRSNTEEFLQKANKIHGDKFDYSKVNYKTAQTKICIICKIHGEFWQNPGNHLNSNQGCPECNKERLKIPHNKQNFEYFYKQFPNTKLYKYDKDTFINSQEKMKIYCKFCEEWFWQAPENHKTQGHKCNQFRSLNKVFEKYPKLKEKPAFLYVFKFSNKKECFYKIGITCNVKRRIKDLSKNYTVKEIMVKGDTRYKCFLKEQRMLYKFKEYKYEPKIKFRGHTECISICPRKGLDCSSSSNNL